MTNFARSLVRTYTPIVIGFGVSCLAHLGIKNPAAVSAIGAAAAAAYFTVVRLVEAKFPQAGKLLGAVGAPVYPAKPAKLLIPTAPVVPDVAGKDVQPPVQP